MWKTVFYVSVLIFVTVSIDRISLSPIFVATNPPHTCFYFYFSRAPFQAQEEVRRVFPLSFYISLNSEIIAFIFKTSHHRSVKYTGRCFYRHYCVCLFIYLFLITANNMLDTKETAAFINGREYPMPHRLKRK